MKSLLVFAVLAIALGALVTGCATNTTTDTTVQTGEQPTSQGSVDDATLDAVVTDDSDVELGELV